MAFGIHSLVGQGATFQATTQVLVGPALSSNADSSQMDVARRVAQIYAQLATSLPLLERMSAELGLAVEQEDLRDLVTATAPEDPPILTITAIGPDPETAAAMANEVVRQLIEASPAVGGDTGETRDFLDRQADAIQQEIGTVIPEIEELSGLSNRSAAEDERLLELQARLTTLQTTFAAVVSASTPDAGNLLTVIEEATPAAAEGLPSGRLQVTVFAAVLGLIVAGIAAFMAEKLDDTIKSTADIRRTTGFRDLGQIGRIAKKRGSTDGPPILAPEQASLRESFRSLRTSIDFANLEPIGSLMLTSSVRREGRTTLAANLAVAFAETGRQVLLVDADLRQPAIHLQFGATNHRGVADLLKSPELPLDGLVQDTMVPGLRLLTAGSQPAASTAVAVAHVGDLTARLAESGADLLIFDSAAVLNASETVVLASIVEATVLVVAAGRTSLSDLQAARDALARSRARVAGTVVNRVPRRRGPGRSPRVTPRRETAPLIPLGEDRPSR